MRRTDRVIAAVLAAFWLGGCGVVPALPGLPSLSPDEIQALDLTADAALPTAELAALTPDGFDAIQRMAARVRNVGCGEISIGSGFAIDDHTLVTNRHVVANSQYLQVSTYDGQDVDVMAASVAGFADLAVVHTNNPLPAYTQLAEADAVVGEEITVVGFPRGGALTVSNGRVLGVTRDPLNANLGPVLATDVIVEEGSSGSPALNSSGQVIGVVYARSDNSQTLLVPVSALRDLLDDPVALLPIQPCDPGFGSQ